MGTCTAVKREIALTVNCAELSRPAGQKHRLMHTTFKDLDKKIVGARQHIAYCANHEQTFILDMHSSLLQSN
jgi:hypothetical protein